MYTIDLLKSSGLPRRSNMKNAVNVGILFSIPILIFIIMTSSYAQSRIVIDNHRKTLGHYENRFTNLKKHMMKEQLISQRYKALNSSLHEVKDTLNNNIQWTPSLAMIERLLPSTLSIERMEVKIKTFQKAVPQREKPEVKINIAIYKRILTIYLQSSSKINSDETVTRFKNNLASSPLLQKQIRDITISSRKPERIDGIDVMSYEMNCTLGGEI
jgi:hypothetical protein